MRRTTTQFMQRRAKDQKYAFDRVFGETTTQLEVYEGTTKKLIPSVLSGYNATVFAYGPTGAGKTYTMMGCDESGPGVMALTMIDLFTEIEKCKSEKQVKVSMSYLEVYNEHIFDLLSAPMEKKQTLELREDREKGVIVAGLTHHYPDDADEVCLSIMHLHATCHMPQSN
jgi:kinesin family member 18/19